MGNGITRAGVASARAAGTTSVEAIRAAIAACDPDRGAEIALARLQTSEPLPMEVVVELVPALLDVPVGCGLVALATGDRGAAALTMLERFPIFVDALPLEVMMLWAAWRADGDAGEVAYHARRLARRKLDKTERILLAQIAAGLGDANVSALVDPLGKPKPADAKPLVAEADKLLAQGLAQLVAELPAQADASKSIGFTVRSAPRVGRNEPCPCGSGQKYKKCHADKDAALEASPVAGMSWEDFLRDGAPKMTVEDVEGLSMFDLARVDPAKLEPGPAMIALRRFVRELYWERATAVVEAQCARLPDAEERDGIRDELVANALDRGVLDVARAQLAKYEVPDPIRVLELALHDGTATLPAIEELAGKVLDSEAGSDVDFAHALMRGSPALGILVARGAILPGRELDNEFLLEAIEETRDLVALPPDDRAWAMVPAKTASPAPHARAANDDETTVLHGSLRETRARVERLEHALATARAELAERDRAAAAAAAAPVDPEKLRELRRRIDELEGLVREGVAERTELRRQLGAAVAQAPAGVAAVKPADELDAADEGDEVEDIARDVAIPSFSRRTLDALESVPRAVAAETMRTVGALAAGDTAAWRRAKLARDMAKQVAMARVGIHHRLLFRSEGGTLEVMDLITREELLTTLKRMRANRT